MLDTDKELAACTAINHQIKAWALEPHNTWVVAVADSGEVDGSSAGLQRLKNKITPFEQWHARLVSDIPSAGKKIKSEDCVVLFDDFVGTGSKMIRKQKWLLRILGDLGVKDVKIYFACFAGMEFGLNEISTTLSAPVFAAIALKRAITESLPADRVSVAAALMQQIEGELAPNYKNKKLADYSFGYQKSEALYCAANDNCPNNVFPVLWWAMRKGNKPFKTLLKRAG
jgi:hypothetical protein